MSSRVPNVLPDANVLYSRTLRDWFCLVATRSGPPLFHLRWSEDILAELVYHLRKNHPHFSDRQIGGVRDRIISVAEHGPIRGYEIDPDLEYTDEYDAHLHAAAEHGGVQYVITNDRGFHDFAAANDDHLGYEVYTPDDFLMLVHRDAIATVREALLDQIAYFRRRGEPFNLAARLESAQAPKFAAAVREMMQAPAVAQALSYVSDTTR
ncbi:PIN domain-containing protein [Rhodococcus sp. NPDC058505]|uniref:PIN domain-containing protein n=1 Tax=unclassified Rhodococcus (in: high G+C Gram-positive bacteria) TaxID=192944 RepID=UPI00365E0CF7